VSAVKEDNPQRKTVETAPFSAAAQQSDTVEVDTLAALASDDATRPRISTAPVASKSNRVAAPRPSPAGPTAQPHPNVAATPRHPIAPTPLRVPPVPSSSDSRENRAVIIDTVATSAVVVASEPSDSSSRHVDASSLASLPVSSVPPKPAVADSSHGPGTKPSIVYDAIDGVAAASSKPHGARSSETPHPAAVVIQPVLLPRAPSPERPQQDHARDAGAAPRAPSSAHEEFRLEAEHEVMDLTFRVYRGKQLSTPNAHGHDPVLDGRKAWRAPTAPASGSVALNGARRASRSSAARWLALGLAGLMVVALTALAVLLSMPDENQPAAADAARNLSN